MFALVDMHLQLRHLQVTPRKPERGLEAVMTLLQRVNFAGNIVCNNSVYFIFLLFLPGRMFSLPPPSFLPPLPPASLSPNPDSYGAEKRDSWEGFEQRGRICI